MVAMFCFVAIIKKILTEAQELSRQEEFSDKN